MSSMSKIHRSSSATAAAVAGFALSLVFATAALAADPTPTPPAKKGAAAAPTQYECSKCHMKYAAAVAKKDHYKDPMDGGTLVPVKPAAKVTKATPPAKKGASTMSGMPGM